MPTPSGRRIKARSWIAQRRGVLLDVGCGPSDGLSPFSEYADDVIALDMNRAFLATRSRTDNLHSVLGDAVSLPFSDCTFQTVVATEVLEHVSSDVAMVSEIRRVLEPNGRFIITVPNKGLFAWLDVSHFPLAKAVLRVIGKDVQPVHRHYSLKGLETMLGDDFRIETISRTGCGVTGICVLLVQLSKLMKIQSLERLFNTIGAYDYRLEYGPIAFNLAISATKVNGTKQI